MRAIYSFSIILYSLLIRLAAPFNNKAKLWLIGRKNWKSTLPDIPENSLKFWFHCASLGEFEQGRPLIEEIKKRHPNAFILLSFFSPSGFESCKNYNQVNKVVYLPSDTPSNASYFIQKIKPNFVFFVKYEFWYNFLYELNKQNIKFYLVSSVFRKSHVFFKFWGKWFLNHLNFFTCIYTQNEESYNLLKNKGLKNIKLSGDTRFDRVLIRASQVFESPALDLFCAQSPILVAGSTWPDDEKTIYAAWLTLKHSFPNLKLIIAPHEVNSKTTHNLFQLFKDDKPQFWTQIQHSQKDARVLIVDTIGILSALYRKARLAYIGGGFNKGIHNTLEAAVYSVPLVFGPKYHKFNEAILLLNLKAAFSINNASQLCDITTFLINDSSNQAGKKAANFVLKNAGATHTVLNDIKL